MSDKFSIDDILAEFSEQNKKSKSDVAQKESINIAAPKNNEPSATMILSSIDEKKKSDNKPALNSDLWEKLLNLLSKHKYDFRWVKGHNGHPENEICDKLATDAIKNLKHTV